jgi:hypothetical protein
VREGNFWIKSCLNNFEFVKFKFKPFYFLSRLGPERPAHDGLAAGPLSHLIRLAHKSSPVPSPSYSIPCSLTTTSSDRHPPPPLPRVVGTRPPLPPPHRHAPLLPHLLLLDQGPQHFSLSAPPRPLKSCPKPLCTTLLFHVLRSTIERFHPSLVPPWHRLFTPTAEVHRASLDFAKPPPPTTLHGEICPHSTFP